MMIRKRDLGSVMAALGVLSRTQMRRASAERVNRMMQEARSAYEEYRASYGGLVERWGEDTQPPAADHPHRAVFEAEAVALNEEEVVFSVVLRACDLVALVPAPAAPTGVQEVEISIEPGVLEALGPLYEPGEVSDVRL